MIKIEYEVELLTPAVTAKNGTIGKELDVSVKINKKGQSYYSAKHIKGVLKSKILEFKNALGLNGKEFVREYFGTENKISKFRFSDLILEKTEKELEKSKGYRYGVKINRKTRTSGENTLFNYEFIKPKNIYVGYIEVENIEKEDLKFILACLFHLDRIGGLKSRGIGKINVRLKYKNEYVDIEKLDDIVNECVKENKNNLLYKISEDNEYVKYNYKLTFLEPLILKEKSRKNEIEVRNSLQASTIRGALIQYGIDKTGEKNVDKLLNISIDGAINYEDDNEKIILSSLFETKYPVNGEKIKVDKIIEEKNEYEVKESGEKIKLERGSLDLLNSAGTEISIKINEKTRTTEEGMIFNTEYIETENKNSYRGTVSVPSEVFKDKECYLKIGKFKTKGFGKIKIEFFDYKPEMITKETIRQKIKKLNNMVNKTNKEIDNDKKIVTFDLLSDIILPFNQVKNIGEEIKILFGSETENKLELNFTKTFVNVEKLEGYSIVNNLRKNDEIIVKSGSVLTYFINNSEIENVLEKLVEIEKNGIGLRRNEGFGKVRICSERDKSC
jgi:hypothetical protein